MLCTFAVLLVAAGYGGYVGFKTSCPVIEAGGSRLWVKEILGCIEHWNSVLRG